MPTFFAKRELIDAEYKRLFLERLSNIDLLKQALCARYDKKAVTEQEIKQLMTNNHQSIYSFTGICNDSRITHFFGSSEEHSPHDTQIRIVDKLLLDCIHFEVITVLMTRFTEEYATYQEEIDKAWEEEIKNQALSLEHATPFILIQNALKNNKKRVFSDLIFPKTNSVELFAFRDSQVIPNQTVFVNWLPASPVRKNNDTKKTLLIIAGSLLAAAVLLPGVFFASPEMTMAAIGLVSSSIPTVSILFLTVFISLCFISYKAKPPVISAKNSLSDRNDSLISSHALMLGKMPGNSNEPSSEEYLSPPKSLQVIRSVNVPKEEDEKENAPVVKFQ